MEHRFGCSCIACYVVFIGLILCDSLFKSTFVMRGNEEIDSRTAWFTRDKINIINELCRNRTYEGKTWGDEVKKIICYQEMSFSDLVEKMVP